jgi:hypothetical protein
MKFAIGFDLRAQVGRSAEQKPGDCVRADCDLRLRPGFSLKGSGAHSATVGAGAIPLGESSPGGGAENLHAHD